MLPDNVLFEAGVGADIRRDLMDKCNLHTLLRLPTGIFYAQGVKTNVLFFDKVSQNAQGSTQEVWVHDLRANMPRFGKRTPLTRAHFADFEAAYARARASTKARAAACAAFRATGSGCTATASTLPGSRTTTPKTPPTSPNRPYSRRRRWANSKARWPSCRRF